MIRHRPRCGQDARPFLLLLLAVVLAASGCDRKPRFVSAGSDSTAVPPDSLVAYIEQARGLWEAGEGEKAAGLTARLILEDLRARPDQPMNARARAFVDSLGFGAEVTGKFAVTAVNLFPAANPTGQSWPYLYWREKDEVFYQPLQGSGLRLVDLTAEGGEGTASGANVASRVALLFTRTAGGGQQPIAYVWRRAAGPEGWKLIQTLGPDSLGGTGSARFTSGEADGAVLVTRTWSRTTGFDECPACPHLIRNRRFGWGEEGLVSAGEEIERSPYYTFVRLIQALTLGDRELAHQLVADPSLVDAALGYDWGRARGLWRVAPGADGREGDMVVFRGNQEAYRVHFSRRGGDWIITGFEPTSRSIE
jgi:hypothetical protein